MTGESRSEHPWWEFDPSERPVPLDPNAEWRVDDDAQLIVASEREAIGRQDTEPNLRTLLEAARARRESASSGEAEDAPRSFRLRPAVLLLAAGCVAMFLHGWSYGAARHTAPMPTSPKETPEVPIQGLGGVDGITSSMPNLRFANGLATSSIDTKEVTSR